MSDSGSRPGCNRTLVAVCKFTTVAAVSTQTVNTQASSQPHLSPPPASQLLLGCFSAASQGRTSSSFTRRLRGGRCLKTSLLR